MAEKKSFNINRILKLVEGNTERQKELRLALDSVKKHMDHCWYHHHEFEKAVSLHEAAFHKNLPDGTEVIIPEYYRCSFEANSFAFFRALHAVIDSLPFILYLLDGELDYTTRVEWRKAKKSLKDIGAKELSDRLIAFTGKVTYTELNNLVNTTKHRRLPKIDSRIFSINGIPEFVKEDLDFELMEYSISKLMKNYHHEIIEVFLVEFISDLGVHLTLRQAKVDL